MHCLTVVHRDGREDLRLRRASRVKTCPLIYAQPVMEEGKVSAGRGSLAAGNGHTSISSSGSLCGPVPRATKAGESDAVLSS